MLAVGMEDRLNHLFHQRRLGSMDRRNNGKPGLHQPPLFRQVAYLQLHQPVAVLAQRKAILAGEAYRVGIGER